MIIATYHRLIKHINHSHRTLDNPSIQPLFPYSSREGWRDSWKPVSLSVNYSFSLIFQQGTCAPTNDVVVAKEWTNRIISRNWAVLQSVVQYLYRNHISFSGSFKLNFLVFITDIGEVIRTRHQQRRRTLSAGKKDVEAIKAVTVSWHFWGLLAVLSRFDTMN